MKLYDRKVANPHQPTFRTLTYYIYNYHHYAIFERFLFSHALKHNIFDFTDSRPSEFLVAVNIVSPNCNRAEQNVSQRAAVASNLYFLSYTFISFIF